MMISSILITCERPIDAPRRRMVCGFLALTTSTLLLRPYTVSAQERATGAASSTAQPEAVQFTWSVRSGTRENSIATDLGKAKAALQPQRRAFKPPIEEAGDYGDPAFAPMVLIAGAAALWIIADIILRFRRDLVGGTIVDVRTSTLAVRENPKIPAGMVIVVGPSNNVVKFEPNATVDIATLVKAITETGKKSQ